MLVYMQLLPFLLQNEAEKSKRRRRAQDDSLSTQSTCALHVAAQKFADCCIFVMTPLLRICKCVMHWHAFMCKQVKLCFLFPVRDVPRCSGTTLQWGNTCTPMGLECTSAQSAAKHLSRVRNWRGINSYTRERNLSRWGLARGRLSVIWLSQTACKYLLWFNSRT